MDEHIAKISQLKKERREKRGRVQRRLYHRADVDRLLASQRFRKLQEGRMRRFIRSIVKQHGKNCAAFIETHFRFRGEDHSEALRILAEVA